MANREAAEVEFEVDGVTYILRLDVNAMIAVQQDCKLDDQEFWSTLGSSLSISLPMLRSVFHRGVRVGEDRLAKVEKAGELVTKLGTHRAVALVSEAITWSLPPKPPKREGDGKGGAAEPPARPSSGPMST